MALMGFGCSGRVASSASGLDSPTDIAPLVERVLAIRGRDLVIPITSVGPDPGGRSVEVRLGDTAARGALHRFAIIGAPPSTWLSTARTWRPVRELGNAAAPSLTIDLLVLLSDEAGTGDLLFDGERIEIEWRDDEALDANALFALSAAPAELRTAPGQSSLYQSLEPALADPTARWRVRLLAERLRTSGFEIPADRITAPRFEHPALEAFASLNERRWHLGLARLARADPLLARDVASALTRIATIDGLVRPSWTPSIVTGAAGGVDQMLSDLLDEDLSIATMLARVDAWLETQPRAVAWVMDDAGAASPGGGLALARMGIVDLAGRGGIAHAALNSERPGPGVTIPPLGGGIVVASDSLPTPTNTVRIALGDWAVERAVAPGALPVRPPGLRLAPLLAPWNLATWLTGTPSVAAPDHATAGLLTRRPDGQWELRIECRVPPGAIPPGDSVRVCFGSARQPRAMLRLDPRGFQIDELESIEEDEAPTRTPLAIRLQDDRWSCVIPVPDHAVENGSLLRIGLERRDDSGRRWTWPRPVLPEQEQPGRALLDLNAWFGFRVAQ